MQYIKMNGKALESYLQKIGFDVVDLAGVMDKQCASISSLLAKYNSKKKSFTSSWREVGRFLKVRFCVTPNDCDTDKCPAMYNFSMLVISSLIKLKRKPISFQCQKIGITRMTMNNILNGKDVTNTTLQKLSNYYGVGFYV